IQLLREKGANVSYHDPYVPKLQFPQNSLASTELNKKSLSSADCVVIATDHSCYNIGEVIAQAKLIFDTRGATKALKGNNIVRLGG
ncbi:MAG: UDP-N-acetyl-D-glucosamine dehydrogenase, partial [Chloroflexi bacterium]|nr:UDP-N-acetyl-D-glucosamine dehydrogenase [Chloroflexota bacterium]